MKQPFLPYGKPNLCIDYILKDPKSIDRFYINFPYHCVLKQVPSRKNLLANMVLWKEVVQPTKKPRSVGPQKSNQRKQEAKRKHTSKIR